MPGMITQSTVLLLARKRLERIEKLLNGKVRSAGQVRGTERQVLYLTRKALAALRTPPLPAVDRQFTAGTFTPWLAGGISMYATAGAVALDYPREAARHARGQAWLGTTLQGGSGDPLRQRVRNPSGRLLLRFAQHVRRAILEDSGIAEGDKAAALAAMRAYAIGHASQIAARLAAAPYLTEVDDQPGRSTPPARVKPGAAAVRGAIEAGVDRGTFFTVNPARTFWQGWLPEPSQLPDHLFEAYAAAAAEVYGPGARVGGGKAFDDALAAAEPPELSARLLRDGYEAYRSLALGRYGWSYGDWLGGTIFMFLPFMLMMPFAALLPNGKDLRRDPAPPGLSGERAWFELLSFPFAFGALGPLIVTLKVMLGSYLGAGKETIFALVNAIVGLVVAIVFFATLPADVPAGVRWPLLFIAPLVADIVLMIFLLVRADGDERRRQLAFGATMRLAMSTLFIVSFLAFLHYGIEGLVDDGIESGAFWGLLVLWLAMAFGAWLGFTAILVRPQEGVGPAAAPDPEITGRKQWLRLFDDTSLRPEGSGEAAQPLYPGDLEPALKLVWTGAGDLYIRPDRSALTFAFDAAGSAPLQTIPAPLAPMTTSEFAALLTKAVAEPPGDAYTGMLTVTRLPEGEPFDAPLPTGEVFANHGDREATAEARAARAGEFHLIPKSGEGYTLYLAPRARQAIVAGRGGEVLLTPAQDAAVAAPPGRLLAIPAAGSANVVGGSGANATRFLDTFQVGDVIEVLTAPVQARVVVAVIDDNHLTVNLALGAVPANTAYRRRARDRDADLAGPGGVLADANVLRRLVPTGAAQFETMFMPGDIIEILPGGGAPPERRTVLEVLRPAPGQPAALRVDEMFSPALPRAVPPPPPLPAGIAYRRPGRVSQVGVDFVPADPTALFGGISLVDRAADLATLLALGVSANLLTDQERAEIAGGGADAHAAIVPAEKVFRDWNLNHRRVNEWRMLVEGRAHPEPDTHEVANRMGWSPLLARWLDMAHRPSVDSHADVRFRPQDPTNRELSAALAFLLDLPAPA
ncbi:MAG TPA: hypothetical protein VN279_04260 [Rhodocyclaceae bacterium]|nr:hypothetical protein [Rhodocyclaceae bacterium]